MGKIVLTGIGPLTPIGTGKKQFWNAVMEGSSGIKKITRFSKAFKSYGGEISGINFDEYINDRRFRRAADISKYAMTAINLAINDTGIKTLKGEDTALVVGLTHGALNYTEAYHRSLITKEGEDISPILFSDSVLNAPAGNASICFDINGPVHTLIGGATTAIKAMILACQILNNGLINKSIVVSAEELNELSFFCHSKFGMNTISEGAGAILIENENTMTVPYPYCYISGIASRFNPSNLKMALNEAIERCLNTANLMINDIDLVLVDSSVNVKKNIPLGCIIPFTGNAFTVTTIWHVILAALIIINGILPPTVINNEVWDYNDPYNINHLMVCTAEKEGNASAVILSKYSS